MQSYQKYKSSNPSLVLVQAEMFKLEHSAGYFF